MLSKITSFGLNGIDGYNVDIEIDVATGLPGTDIVGLADTATKESKERVKSAIKNSGFGFSPKRITVNLAPADIKKEGSYYDLPIAVGILTATEQIDYKLTQDVAFVGELGLDGKLRRLSGILPMLIYAKDSGIKTVVIPKANENEARYIDGISVFALESLCEVKSFLENRNSFSKIQYINVTNQSGKNFNQGDFKFVKGQAFARRAMEVAAAGGHNIILIGPPGGGKTMLAKCLPSILPDMTADETLETTKIHSVAGVLDINEGIVSNRPFRTPHHTSSRIALTGGGPTAKPGEVSLAHNGVLFLDEILEYNRSTLEILRQPLEDNLITVARAHKTVTYPANFMLVASMNPCPCGNFGSKSKECSCTPAQITKYLSKLSGPLLDRIDIHIEVDDITYSDLSGETESESSKDIKRRVDKARELQLSRYGAESDANDKAVHSNSAMTQNMLKKYCKLDAVCENALKMSFERLGLSARAYTRILKVARTIADLEGAENITISHLSEAISYRSLDRNYWN